MLTHPSPHFNSRSGKPCRVLVLHSDAGASDAGTLGWLADPVSKVSYHALIGRNGKVYSCVRPEHRAWHAGVSLWQGVKDVNSISYGLAYANRNNGKEALTPVQVAAGLAEIERLARTITTLEAVTTHAAIAPGRKTDPLNSVGFVLADAEAAFARGVAAR